jgi:CDP-diacylglycerol--glycerol-3-phosphate 3-phosphatidyltransferase
MIPLLSSARRNNKILPGKTLARLPFPLRRQAWLAAAFLFSPFLATLFLNYSLLRQHPLTLFTLLPGLLVAIILQRQLLTNLEANHRSGETNQLFPTLGAANWITLLRASAIVVLAGFLPLAVQPGNALPPSLVWAPGLIYLTISLADLADGYVARKQHRETDLGKRLDIATDGAGVLVALLVAIALQRLPAITLLVGLAYYLYNFGIWWRQLHHRPLIALQSRPYSRIIAGFQMGLVAMALLPIIKPPSIVITALLVMTPLLFGFVRDWLVVSCRIEIDRNQQTILDYWPSLILSQYFPLVLRLGVVACGIFSLAADAVYTISPFWLIAQSLCCLLIGLGCMGRSAALLLVLILSCDLNPMVMDIPSFVLLTAAATLMLTGTGPLSAWAPEEHILYRRSHGESFARNERA